MPKKKIPAETIGDIATIIRAHFAPTGLQNITISERQFPFRVRADLQRAVDRLFDSNTVIRHFCGVRREYSHEGLTLSDCVVENQRIPATAVPPQYEEVDVGDEQPVRCLKNGIWFLRQDKDKYVVLLAPVGFARQATGIQFQIAVVNDEGRQKLVRLYSQGIELDDNVVQAIVQRTEKVSAAFIKELMRRSVQFHLERNGTGCIELPDVEQALEEMLFSGGSLNLKLLGAEGKCPLPPRVVGEGDS
jgi:hypothetical protein